LSLKRGELIPSSAFSKKIEQMLQFAIHLRILLLESLKRHEIRRKCTYGLPIDYIVLRNLEVASIVGKEVGWL